MPYINDNFMLNTPQAVELYNHYAKNEPIFDFHCHLSPKDIYEDRRFANITELWLSGDHYKWRLMRANGVPEELITGDGDPYEKFLAWAGTVERSPGNPLYAWTHLELARYFGVYELLNQRTAPEIWEKCNAALSSLSARSLIQKSKVSSLCTTDDPADSLEFHKAIRADKSFNVNVLPAFRPETALHPENPDFANWIDRLSHAAGIEIKDISDLIEALSIRAEYFKENGCVIADQSLTSPDFSKGSKEEAEGAFGKALAGELLSPDELNSYQSYLMLSLGRIYHRVGFVMQLHLGVLRNVNSRLFTLCGADTGFDCAGDGVSAMSVASLFDRLNVTDELPKTVVYSLNAGDDDKLVSVLASFNEGCFPQKMQIGAPWWFSDHRDGMEKLMRSLANGGLLSGFIGMLTDSRSFVSYARHEYFRRVLCDLFGGWMARGEVPADMELIGGIVKDICYKNAAKYFGI